MNKTKLRKTNQTHHEKRYWKKWAHSVAKNMFCGNYVKLGNDE